MSHPSVPPPGSPGHASPVVGRLAERALLGEELLAARSGHCRVAVISGEAGIGKTTLARLVAGEARSLGFQVLIGHNQDLMAAAPYGPWLAMLERYEHECVDVELPHVFHGATIGEISSQDDVFVQMRDFLRRQASAAPLLLVFEDAHWADPASIDLLWHLAGYGLAAPLMILMTHRLDETGRATPFQQRLPALFRVVDALRIDLRPFTHGELQALVTARYGLPDLDRDHLVSYLETHAEGNPLFTSEVLRTLEQTPRLAENDTGWQLGELGDLIVPDLVRQVIEARAARLGTPARDALAVAAVIGQDVSIALWTRIAETSDHVILDIIDAAVDASLLVATSDGLRVQFVHAITREALYQSIAPPRRRLIHGAVARALQEQDRIDPDPVAYHLQQSADPAAPAWLIEAGDRAQRAYAWHTAADRFRVAADILADYPEETASRSLLLYRSGRLRRYSNAAQGIADIDLAARLATQVGDNVLACDADHSHGLLLCFADQWDTGLRLMEQGAVGLEALDPEEVRRSWSALTWMADALPQVDLPAFREDDPAVEHLVGSRISHRRGALPWFEAASGHLGRALSGASDFLQFVGDPGSNPMVMSAVGHSCFGQGIGLSCMGRPDDARSSLARGRDLYRQLDHHAGIAFSLLTELNDVILPWFATDLAARSAIADEAGNALARGGGALPSGVPSEWSRLPLMYLEGHWERARELGATFPMHGSYALRRQATRSLAPIALHQGEQDIAWNHVLAILPDGHATSPGSAVFLDALMLQGIAIDLCLESGDGDEARRWLDAQARWLAWSGSLLGQADHVVSQARLAGDAGHTGEAERLAIQAMEMAGRPAQPMVTLRARRLLGELALDRREFDSARHEWTAAIALADAIGSPYERAMALEGLARSSWNHEPEAAIGHLLEARSLLAPLGAAPALRRVDALLDRSGARKGILPLPNGLTAREVDVLRLVAQGLTDADVGDRLAISPRTVGQHLRSTYGKIGVKSRAGATRFAIEHDLA